ncbi:MAG: glycogen/starch/alpha-glucan phosphorylase [Myxococcota bacterium]
MNPTPPPLSDHVRQHLRTTCMIDPAQATPRDVYQALAHSVRDRLVAQWQRTSAATLGSGVKEVHYLSAEFLLGRALTSNLIALDLYDEARDALSGMGVDLGSALEQERDPGLGNGGLGRLAACFMESMATLGLPGFGQGIRYEFGIFEQAIVNGQQVEQGDDWLRFGNVWEVMRPEDRVAVQFYGRVQHETEGARFQARWLDTRPVWGVPYDTPIVGHDATHINTLRLWSAQPRAVFDLGVFNAGDYRQATAERTLVEAISKVLYPADHTREGRELRLKQQAFFCTCAIADLLRRFDQKSDDLNRLPDLVAVQLNDTHPAVTVAELMRVLVDERSVPWTMAWELTQKTVAYTNHTLMPEALERWPADLFSNLLPRHFEIIAEIDRRFAIEVQEQWPGEPARVERTRILEPGAPAHIHMAHLATVGSHAVNGVAALHSKLVKSRLLPDFAQLYPDRFSNKTNGVTPRRWIRASNPGLSSLLDKKTGTGWTRDLGLISAFEPHVADADCRLQLRSIKRNNKVRLAHQIQARFGRQLDPDAIFDVQIKRIHEYKRQVLCGLYVASRALRLADGESLPARAVLFGGKAAPGYLMAKHHIRFLCDLGEALQREPSTKKALQLVFIENYGVSWAELLIPAADLSEQISMAGKEASGTGNMKFTMNGALTIGTPDGANVEIREAVGEEHFFLFGHTAQEVQDLKDAGYDPAPFIERSPALARVLDRIEEGWLSPDEPDRYRGLVHDLRTRDPWLVCADFDSYCAAQDAVDTAWADGDAWSHSAGLNIARSGRFSSDRTIGEYAAEIWGVAPMEIGK